MKLFKKLIRILLKIFFVFIILTLVLYGIVATFMYFQKLHREKEIATQRADTFTIPSETQVAPDILAQQIQNTLFVGEGLFETRNGNHYEISVYEDKNTSYIPIGVQIHNQRTGNVIRTKKLSINNDRYAICSSIREKILSPVVYTTGTFELYGDETPRYDQPRIVTLYIKTETRYFSIDREINANNPGACSLFAIE